MHEETEFVLDSLHDRKPMQLLKGRELHGRVVSGRACVVPPRTGLSAVVPLEGRRGRRCSSRGTTAQGPRPVALTLHYLNSLISQYHCHVYKLCDKLFDVRH